jgi:hypothetical protein
VKDLRVSTRDSSEQRRPEAEEDMKMPDRRGMKIHFNDGSSLTVGFPVQSDNTYARAILGDEILKSRRLVVQADGALLVIPFENVKYLSIYPAPEELPAHTILGGSVDA